MHAASLTLLLIIDKFTELFCLGPERKAFWASYMKVLLCKQYTI